MKEENQEHIEEDVLDNTEDHEELTENEYLLFKNLIKGIILMDQLKINWKTFVTDCTKLKTN